MKRYTAKHSNKQFVLFSENYRQVGRIINAGKFYKFDFYIELSAEKYDIKTVGFLNSNLELYDLGKLVYFTDFGKDRIIRSGDTEIYTYKFGKKNQLFHKGKLLITVRREKKWFKDPVYFIEADNEINDLLILFFLFYSDNDFNTTNGGD